MHLIVVNSIDTVEYQLRGMPSGGHGVTKWLRFFRSLQFHGERKHTRQFYILGLVQVIVVHKRTLAAQRCMVCIGEERMRKVTREKLGEASGGDGTTGIEGKIEHQEF